MRTTLWNQNREGRALPDHAFDANTSAMQPHQLMHQSQSDTTSLLRATTGVLDAVKPFEQTRHFVGRNTDAGIGDAQRDTIVGRLHAHVNLAGQGKLERIREQVQDDFLPHFAIHKDRFGKRWTINHQPQPGPLDRSAENTGEISCKAGQVCWLIGSPDAAGFDA